MKVRPQGSLRAWIHWKEIELSKIEAEGKPTELMESERGLLEDVKALLSAADRMAEAIKQNAHDRALEAGEDIADWVKFLTPRESESMTAYFLERAK